MKKYLISIFICFHAVIGICETNRHLKISADCTSGSPCLELMLEDHRGNKLGFDPKTGKTIEKIEGGVYMEESVPNLDEPDSSRFKVIEVVEPLPGIYRINLIGINTGIFVVPVRVSIDADVGEDVLQEKTITGIISKGETQSIGLTIPMGSTKDSLINKNIDATVLEKEIISAKNAGLIKQKSVIDKLVKNIRNVSKMQKNKRKEEAIKSAESIIRILEHSETSSADSQPLTAEEALLDDAKLFAASIK